MASAGLVIYGLLAVCLGGVIGWYARQARGAHGDMTVNKARVPSFRRARNRAGMVAVVLIVLSLLAIKALALT